MASYQDGRMVYSNEELLTYAYTMLEKASEEQRSPNKWLSNNHTMQEIRDRVREIEIKTDPLYGKG